MGHRTAARLAIALLFSIALPASPAFAQSGAMREIAIAENERRWDDGVLRGYLASEDASVRARACLAVGRLQDSTSVPALLPMLEDPDPAVRHEALFALGQIGHASAREAVEKYIAADDDVTAYLALEALGKIGDKASTPGIADMLRSERDALRGAAAVALWRLADSTAVDRLLERHDDPNTEVRWRVMYALERITAPQKIVLIAALHQDDENWLVRAYVARTLGRQGSSRGTSYLLQMMNDEVAPVTMNAIRGLRQIADSTCAFCPISFTRLLSNPNPHVRLLAAEALGDPFALASADSGTRVAAIDSLRAHVADPDGAARAAAATSLVRILGEDAWPDAEPLLEDYSIYVRTAALQAAAQIEADWVDDLLIEKLGWNHPLFERMTAALALGTRKTLRAAPILRAELYDQQVLMVAATASALEQMGDSSSVGSLSRVYARWAGSSDADARIGLRDALRTLAGRDYADSMEQAHPSVNEQPESYPSDYGTPPAVRGAVLHTSKGEIEWEFFTQEAPRTVDNFVKLARRGYFDTLAIHRVVPNFVMQDGDPTGTGWGGPGYSIRCEYNQLRYDPGMVGMALSGKDTGGSQWFITHSPQPHLDGRYTIFAKVVRGMEVVHQIVQGDAVWKVDILD